VGAGLGETVYTDVTKSFRSRAPWLLLNLVLALMVAFAVENQTGVISGEPVLAALMPIVATLGGNGGNQSLAVMIRSLASDDVPRAQVTSILLRQAGVGLLNGLLLAAAAAALTYVLIDAGVFESNSEPLRVALVVGVGCLANLLVATLAGSAIPLVLRRLGLDPALASSILITMITDLVGFGGFLLVAAALL
jgi:magnesium transporter